MGLNVGVVSFFFLFDARTAQTGIGFSCRLQPQEKEQRTAWGRRKERGSAMGLDQGSEPRWSGRARRSRDAHKECVGEETGQLAQVTASSTKTQEQKRARPCLGAPGRVRAREEVAGGSAATPRAAGRALRAVPRKPRPARASSAGRALHGPQGCSPGRLPGQEATHGEGPGSRKNRELHWGKRSPRGRRGRGARREGVLAGVRPPESHRLTVASRRAG